MRSSKSLSPICRPQRIETVTSCAASNTLNLTREPCRSRMAAATPSSRSRFFGGCLPKRATFCETFEDVRN